MASLNGGGGAFGPLVPAVRLNVAGRLGSGRQYWSWISRRDEVCALQFLLELGLFATLCVFGLLAHQPVKRVVQVRVTVLRR